jgi:Na+-transporting methylmalonyl-CoA/oxaloacetate decarboxylase gamma subunit
MNGVALALWITLVGMSLVFGVIFLLWGLITLIMRLGERLDRRRSSVGVNGIRPDLQSQAERQLAAALAVSVALARAQQPAPLDELHIFPLPPTAVVSPWQAVMRAKILNRRGRGR